MVDAKKCDRCEKIYGESNNLILRYLGILNRDGEKFDLCNSCEKDLELFFDYNFEEIEEVKELLKKGKKK